MATVGIFTRFVPFSLQGHAAEHCQCMLSEERMQDKRRCDSTHLQKWSACSRSSSGLVTRQYSTLSPIDSAWL